MESRTDVFLHHNWGDDDSGRDNHQRVDVINNELKARGYKTWFDAEKMTGNIDQKMAQGIAQTKGVIVFITQKYHEKVNDKNAGDNCQKEFMYASRKKTRLNIVAVVMETCMRDTSTWSGLVDFYLGGEMYVDMSGDFENKTYLSQQMDLLVKELQFKGIQPLRETNQELIRLFVDAAGKGDVSKVIELLDAGVPVDGVGFSGLTALRMAARHNRTGVTHVLLKRGADMNKRSGDDHRTALHLAARFNSTDVIEVLLEHGASTKIEDCDGNTPMVCARAWNKKAAVCLLKRH